MWELWKKNITDERSNENNSDSIDSIMSLWFGCLSVVIEAKQSAKVFLYMFMKNSVYHWASLQLFSVVCGVGFRTLNLCICECFISNGMVKIVYDWYSSSSKVYLNELKKNPLRFPLSYLNWPKMVCVFSSIKNHQIFQDSRILLENILCATNSVPWIPIYLRNWNQFNCIEQTIS